MKGKQGKEKLKGVGYGEHTHQEKNNSSETKEIIEVVNPATLSKIGEVPVIDDNGVKEATQAAREAFKEWSRLSFKERASYLYKIKNLMFDRKEEVVNVISSETGKTKAEALKIELFYIRNIIDFYAKRAESFLKDDFRETHYLLIKTKSVYVSYIPRGVVGFICPWNFPLMLTFGDAVPALMAGNTVIIKPSEIAPLTALLVRDICRDAGLPENVLQVIPGYGETGQVLIRYVDMVAFTGSVSTGKKVMETASRTLTPISLELGGKDPMIVLKDADLERAASATVWGSFINAGQSCIAIERVYVEGAVADEFISMVVDKVKALRQEDLSCMTTSRQFKIVKRHIEDAVKKGAKVVLGGKRKEGSDGYFFEPTVIVDVNHGMDIMREETFGPVIPIMRVRDEEEAISLANDSKYGLNSSIWTTDEEKAKHLARRIQSGNVCINDCVVNYGVLEAPFGGIKESGMGFRHGPEGIRKFCNTQAVLIV